VPCRRPIDAAATAWPTTLDEIPVALFAEAFAWSRRVVTMAPPAMIELGHAVTLWQAGHREDARRLVRDHRLATASGGPMYAFQLDVLRQWGYADLLG